MATLVVKKTAEEEEENAHAGRRDARSAEEPTPSADDGKDYSVVGNFINCRKWHKDPRFLIFKVQLLVNENELVDRHATVATLLRG